jgi:hypothetical protein
MSAWEEPKTRPAYAGCEVFQTYVFEVFEASAVLRYHEWLV